MNRTRMTCLSAAAFAAAAFSAPAAYALHGRDDSGKSGEGNRTMALPDPVSARGFAWGDAAIGAGVAGFGFSFAAGAAALVVKRQSRTRPVT
jgi:hypothetical protein